MKKSKKILMMLLLFMAFVMLPATEAKTVTAQTTAASEVKARNGWVTRNGYRYYYRNGKPVKGWWTIGGKRYYFNRYGRSVTGWLKLGGKRYYLNKQGQAYTGYKKVGKYYYFFDKKYAHAWTGWHTYGGRKCFFDKYGRAIPGWLKQGNKKYYLDNLGRTYRGFHKIGKYRYYFDKKQGHAWVGWHTMNGERYYFDSQGRAAVGYRNYNGYRYRFDSYGRVISAENLVMYRAVVIGESDYPGTSSDLTACRRDASAVRNMLRKTKYSSVSTGVDVSKDRVRDLISKTFSASDSNDVCLFYYTGHGSSDGSLVTTDYDYIYPSELAYWLKQVPGKCVVILDSCFSGQVIGKGDRAKAAESFNQNVIDAFAVAEKNIAKYGPMSNSKFNVLTACSQNEYSYASRYSSFFTNALVSGVGFDYSGKRLKAAPADTNRNKQLTLSECYNYTWRECYGWQNVQCYPDYSNMTLFRR